MKLRKAVRYAQPLQRPLWGSFASY